MYNLVQTEFLGGGGKSSDQTSTLQTPIKYYSYHGSISIVQYTNSKVLKVLYDRLQWQAD